MQNLFQDIENKSVISNGSQQSKIVNSKYKMTIKPKN